MWNPHNHIDDNRLMFAPGSNIINFVKGAIAQKKERDQYVEYTIVPKIDETALQNASFKGLTSIKEINAEYERAFNRFKNVHESAEDNSKTYTKESHETPQEFAKIINTLIKCEGLEIDLVGSWVWSFGNTYPYKELLKDLGFKFSGKHKKWYYHSPDETFTRRSHMKYEEIKDKYGCEHFNSIASPRLATVSA